MRQDEHIILLGEINGKVDILLASATRDDDRIRDLEKGAFWGKGAMALVLLSFYPKARDLIGPLFGV